MAARADTIYVDIEARLGNLERGLKKAEGMVGNTRNKMDKDLSLIGKGIKAGALLNSVEAVAKGITGVLAIAKGDVEGFEKAFRSLPAGIGQAIGSLYDLRDAIFGARKEAEALESAARGQSARDTDAASARGMKSAASLADQNYLDSAKSGYERKVREINLMERDFNAELKRMQKEAGSGGFGANTSGSNEFQKQSKERIRILRKQLEDEFAERGQVMREEDNKARAEEMDQQKRAADEKQKAQLDADRRLVDMQFALKEKQAKAQGDQLQAELVAIRRFYHDKIMLASGAEKDTLEKLRQLDEQEARRKASAAGSTSSATRKIDQQEKAMFQQISLPLGRIAKSSSAAATAAKTGSRKPVEAKQVEDTNKILRGIAAKLPGFAVAA